MASIQGARSEVNTFFDLRVWTDASHRPVRVEILERATEETKVVPKAAWLGIEIDDEHRRLVRGDTVADFSGQPSCWTITRALVRARGVPVSFDRLSDMLSDGVDIGPDQRSIKALMSRIIRPKLRRIGLQVPKAARELGYHCEDLWEDE